MKIELIQNTQEWLDYRKTKIGASEIASIMGTHPWVTERELFLIKTGKKVQKESSAMSYGKEKEDYIRNQVTRDFGVDFEPAVYICDNNSRFMASCDGVSPDEAELIEIKTMGKKSFDSFLINGIPIYYYQQVQWQMMCSGIRFGHLVAFCRDTERLEIKPVVWDSTMIDKMILKAEQFLQKLDTNRDVDNFFHVSDEFDLEELQLLKLDKQIQELKDAIYMLDKEREGIYEKLLAMAIENDVKETTFYRVVKQVRKGKLDETKLLELVPNLESYRQADKEIHFLKRKSDE